MKAQELRNESVDELNAKSTKLTEEMFALTNELRVTRKLDAPHKLKKMRRDRARIKTILREKEELAND